MRINACRYQLQSQKVNAKVRGLLLSFGVDKEIRTQVVGDAPIADLLPVDQRDHHSPVNDEPE